MEKNINNKQPHQPRYASASFWSLHRWGQMGSMHVDTEPCACEVKNVKALFNSLFRHTRNTQISEQPKMLAGSSGGAFCLCGSTAWRDPEPSFGAHTHLLWHQEKKLRFGVNESRYVQIDRVVW